MPRYSGTTFSVQPIQLADEVTGYVVAGFFSSNQLATSREFVDSDEYEKSKRWRGEYQEMAKVIVSAIDEATATSGAR